MQIQSLYVLSTSFVIQEMYFVLAFQWNISALLSSPHELPTSFTDQNIYPLLGVLNVTVSLSYEK